jgi:hypothetical protein
MRKAIAVAVLALAATFVWAQSTNTVTFTNTAKAGYGRSGQFTVPVDPYPNGGSIYYSPVPNSPTVFNIWFWGMTPAVEVTSSNVTATKTRLVEPTSVYRGCPIGALDKLEFTNQGVYDSDGTLDYTLNAEQYIGDYHWSNGGGGRGGGSSGCYAYIMPAGTPLPDGSVTSGGFTSVTYPQ